jgi:imidazole glycerol-phosphate synthase subunit HisF
MFRPRVIPCLLLKDLGLVKTIQFGDPKYIGDPMNAVKIFNDFEVDELVFLDMDASKDNRTIDLEFVKKVGQEAFMPFAVGGGIRSIDQIRSAFNAGAEKVIINTAAIENSEFVREASEIFGSQSIIVSIDVKKNGGNYEVCTHGGSKVTEFDPVYIARKMQESGAGEILINSIDEDGRMEGYDLTLIKRVSEAVSIPVVAIGGAGSLEDFSKAVGAGASAISSGSMFIYSGKNRGILINYPDKEELEEIFETDNFK